MERSGASTSVMSRFETEILAQPENLAFLMNLRGRDDARNCSKSGSGMEVNGGVVPIHREKVDSSRKYAAFLVFNPA